ncbi:hypothetical protein [uncultured Draconibacterium sp.]|uniref:hypothetical protein n=1 Tax=uncultured Draconibacterium sp. TaxID=1573823 RepID=UPI00321635E9
MNYPGLVNVENTVGASALAHFAGATANEIKAGIEDYQGVARRFDIRFKSDEKIYIDDYAHHPEELKAFITFGAGVVSREKDDRHFSAAFVFAYTGFRCRIC